MARTLPAHTSLVAQLSARERAVALLERMDLEFRAEYFNVLNRTNFGQPGNVLGSPSFGIISAAGPARVGQMSLKLVF